MVRLLLHRHEEAEPAGDFGDALRGLTPEGRRRMYAQAQGLAEPLATLDVLYTSPLVRAVQTAEILAQALDPALPVVAHPTVLNPPSMERLLSVLGSRPSPNHLVAMVGHEPTLSRLLHHLLKDEFIGFRTGQGILLAFEPQGWRIEASFRGGERI